MTRNPLIPYALIAVAGIIIIIVLSSIGIVDMNEEAGGEETVAAPEEIYQESCASCHGGSLEGGTAPALDTIGAKLNAEEIADIIQNGTDGGMPPALVTGEAQQKLAEWLAEHQ